MEVTATMTADMRQAFGELLQQHRGIVFKVANTYARDAEDRADLAQDIATQLWRAWPGYDPARRFSTWMYRIALNVAISFVRGNSHRRRHTIPLDDVLHDVVDENAVDHEAAEHIGVLHGFIATLDPLNRALLLLYLDQCSTREMADVLGISESNVTTKISRLKQRLRDHVAPTGHD
ncbi:MAG: RNA polymerase sigma factor [Luteimonas sp.]